MGKRMKFQFRWREFLTKLDFDPLWNSWLIYLQLSSVESWPTETSSSGPSSSFANNSSINWRTFSRWLRDTNAARLSSSENVSTACYKTHRKVMKQNRFLPSKFKAFSFTKWIDASESFIWFNCFSSHSPALCWITLKMQITNCVTSIKMSACEVKNLTDSFYIWRIPTRQVRRWIPSISDYGMRALRNLCRSQTLSTCPAPLWRCNEHIYQKAFSMEFFAGSLCCKN